MDQRLTDKTIELRTTAGSIEELAAGIRELSGLTASPLNVERIIRSYGGFIRAHHPSGVRGVTLYRKDLSFLMGMGVPTVQYPGEVLGYPDGLILLSLEEWKTTHHGRYEIAHLVGHLFLHMHYLDPGNKMRNHFRDTARDHPFDWILLETEANRFANALLMPEDIFRSEAKTFDHQGREVANYKELSLRFKVPVPAVLHYGQRLGIFSKEPEEGPSVAKVTLD